MCWKPLLRNQFENHIVISHIFIEHLFIWRHRYTASLLVHSLPFQCIFGTKRQQFFLFFAFIKYFLVSWCKYKRFDSISCQIGETCSKKRKRKSLVMSNYCLLMLIKRSRYVKEFLLFASLEFYLRDITVHSLHLKCVNWNIIYSGFIIKWLLFIDILHILYQIALIALL